MSIMIKDGSDEQLVLAQQKRCVGVPFKRSFVAKTTDKSFGDRQMDALERTQVVLSDDEPDS